MHSFRAVCLVVLVVVVASFAVQVDAKRNYNTKAGPRDDGILNVHLVCHTHNDVGWLKTVDEYYYGANNSIQHAGVQYILDSTLLALQANPDRKFIYVEIAFFERWWNEQTETTQNEWRALVNNGQVEFINGGWCMNDEACTDYNAIIDQMTLGHLWLLETFGVTPTIGWHIDPFGHSSTQAVLFAEMGFDAFYFGRIDYIDRADRFANQELEFMWESSRSQGSAVNMFSGVTYEGYNPPPGFCFDMFCDDPPIQDDPELEDYNVAGEVEAFVEVCYQQAQVFKTNNIMLTMGSDFMYENANEWYKNLDKLIDYVNADGRVNVFYSTPSIYTQALYDADVTWSVKTDDFFPYADYPYAYWTGYFTSRPAVKGYERMSNGILQTCKQLETFTTGPDQYPPQNWEETSSYLLRQSMAIAQHHDAVTGTSQQHVAYDYALRLYAGGVACMNTMNNALANLTSLTEDWPVFEQCLMLNESVCPPTTDKSQSFVTMVYNPLARERSEFVRIPVGSLNVAVYNGSGDPVPSQTVPVTEATIVLRGDAGDAPYTLVFEAVTPSLGFSTYFVVYTTADDKNRATESVVTRPRSRTAPTVVTNNVVTLTFDTTGLLSNIESDGVKEAVSQTFMWYNASAGNNVNSTQPSGSYIFRPNSSDPFYASGDENFADMTVVSGPLLTEVQQTFANWTSQVYRLWANEVYTDAEFTIGPIPFAGMIGREVISHYSTSMETEAQWWTDSNGREMQHRIRGFQPTYQVNETVPRSLNYYPVNTGIFVRDNSSDSQFAILTDRSQGGSSQEDGEVELMIHRRLMYDDYRGEGYPLNETGTTGLGLVVRGNHRVILSTQANAAEYQRSNQEAVAFPVTLAFAPLDVSIQSWMATHRTVMSMSPKGLPLNVHLLNLEVQRGWVLLRLAHMYERHDNTPLAAPAVVDISQLFSTINIVAVTELSLSANQPKASVNRLKWKYAGYEGDDSSPSSSVPEPSGTSAHDLTVTLYPMQIKTFNCTLG